MGDSQLTITVRIVSFSFPSRGYAYGNHNKLVDECLKTIKCNSTLIKLNKYTEEMCVQYLTSRQERKMYTGMAASGSALVEPKILYLLANGDPKEVKPTITHELMHMTSMTTWGEPSLYSNWMNQG